MQIANENATYEVVSVEAKTQQTAYKSLNLDEMNAMDLAFPQEDADSTITQEVFELDSETKKTLEKCGLLTPKGTVDHDAFRKLIPSELICTGDATSANADDDNRVEYDNTSYPYTPVVYLTYNIPGKPGGYRATGFMVYKNIVLTCGHAVCQLGENKWHTDMLVHGKYKNGEFAVTTRWTKMVTSVAYYSGNNANDDWAIIVTKDNIGNQNSLWQLGIFPEFPEVKGIEVDVVGFPSPVRGNDSDALWGAKGVMGDIHNKNINCYFHGARVSGGQSGGAVISRQHHLKNYVVGIIYGSNQDKPPYMGDCRIVDRGLFYIVLKCIAEQGF